jgi:hypothetical protein
MEYNKITQKNMGMGVKMRLIEMAIRMRCWMQFIEILGVIPLIQRDFINEIII